MAYYSSLLSDLNWCPLNYSELSVWHAVEDRLQLSAPLKADLFPRVQEVVEGIEGDIFFSIEAGINDNGHRQITGALEFTLSLSCQRCLEPFSQSFKFDFIWLLAESEYEADLIGDEVAVLVIEEGYPDQVVHHLEDEILLAMPIIPYHDEESYCAGREFLKQQKRITIEDEKSEKENPFAVLSDLLDN